MAADGLIGVSGELNTAGGTLDTVLEFPTANAVPAHIWHLVPVQDGPPFVHEISAASGDTFTPRLERQLADGTLEPYAGEPLAFDDVPTLYRSTRPVDNGTYEVGLSAAVVGGNHANATASVIVSQGNTLSGYRVYADPLLGISFPYPEGWTRPQTSGTAAHTGDPTGDTTLQVRVVESWTGDAAELLADALSTLGGVSPLFEDTAPIGGEESAITAVRIAYGYPGANGQVRTGILTAFVNDGRGYIVDLDGLQSDEAALLETANTIALNWKFVPRVDDSPAADWKNAVLGGYDLIYPPGLAFEEVNGWYRFVGEDRFIALRVQPATRTIEEALAALLAAAGEEVTGFQITGSSPLYLSGAVWQQADFVYENSAGTPVNGLIVARADGESEIAVWSEWPANSDPAGNRATALAVAASMQRHEDPIPGE
ncbi:MAG: hypothetical protein R3C44_20480 [Chloroflexota bacterium]